MGLSKIDELRRQLREKFPAAHSVQPDQAPTAKRDRLFGIHEFPQGKISEVVPSAPSCGLILLVASLLGDPGEANAHPDFVLVDGADSFDPDSFTGHACSRMLWVRCRSAMEMLKAADLLVNDGNVPFVLLDATGLSRQELGALPAAAWWRLSQTVGRTGGRLVVMSAFPIVPCASLRLSLSAALSLQDFDDARPELVDRLHATPERRRHAT